MPIFPAAIIITKAKAEAIKNNFLSKNKIISYRRQLIIIRKYSKRPCASSICELQFASIAIFIAYIVNVSIISSAPSFSVMNGKSTIIIIIMKKTVFAKYANFLE